MQNKTCFNKGTPQQRIKIIKKERNGNSRTEICNFQS